MAGQLPGDQTDSVLVPAPQQHLHHPLDVTVMEVLCFVPMSLQMSTQLKEHVETFVARSAIVHYLNMKTFHMTHQTVFGHFTKILVDSAHGLAAPRPF